MVVVLNRVKTALDTFVENFNDGYFAFGTRLQNAERV
jgi:hypothetical protein